jgi:hypothetical protein
MNATFPSPFALDPLITKDSAYTPLNCDGGVNELVGAT